MPWAVIGSAESISWKCRCGDVELPVWPTRPRYVADAHLLSVGHRDRARRHVHERGVHVARAEDDVVAEDRRQLLGRERHGVLHLVRQLAGRVDPFPLGHAVDGAHDLGVERRVDGRAPGVGLSRAATEELAAERARRVEVHALPPVDLEEVVRVALPEHVGAVTRHPVGRRRDRHPVLPAQRELDDDGVLESVLHRRRWYPDASTVVRAEPGCRRPGVTSAHDRAAAIHAPRSR